MGKINDFFSFVFINSKINSVIFELEAELKLNQEGSAELSKVLTEGRQAKLIYKKQIRRYLGLGFFLSFIPGTDAFRSREALSNFIHKVETNESELFDEGNILSFPFNILWTTFRALYHSWEKIIVGEISYKEDLKGLNPLNPFLYLTHLVVLLIKPIFEWMNTPIKKDDDNFLDSLFSFSKPLAFVFFIILSLITYILGIPIAILLVLFLATELVLNSLNTLFIEPVKFAFEAIQQLVETWGFEFACLPTEDFEKLEYLIEAEDIELFKELSTKNQFSSQTSELSFIVNSPKAIKTLKEEHHSFFFEQNKDKNLFRENNRKKIRANYNEFTNLKIFYFFTKQIELLNVFPTELTKSIFDLCLKSDLLSHRAIRTTIEADPDHQKPRTENGFEI